MFKIESGIPVPKPVNTGGSSKYPFSEMEVGDSFFAPWKGYHIIWALARRAPQKYGIKLTTRAVTENGVQGVRVWRIE